MAKSIRSQLDSAWDRSLSARELFALVDKDIAENGRWFGRLAIGNEWILGATAMRLDRVRGIFYEMEFHTFNNKSSYSYTLYLYDHNQRGQVHAMGNEDLMMVAFRQICLLVPEAVSGHASQKEAFLKQAEAPTFEADFQARKALRSAQQKDQTQVPQDVVLFDSRGNVTSRVTDEALNQARLALQEKGSHFRLRCTSSLVYQHGSLLFLNCGREANRYFLMYGFVQEADSALLLYRLWLAPADLLEPVRRFVRHKEIPDFQGWERRTLKLSRGE